MISLDPFQRAVLIALAWCLVGLGIDTGANSRPAPGQAADFAKTRGETAERSMPTQKQLPRDPD